MFYQNKINIKVIIDMLFLLLFRISEQITVFILFIHTYFPSCSIRDTSETLLGQIRVYKYVSIVMTTDADITSDAQTTSMWRSCSSLKLSVKLSSAALQRKLILATFFRSPVRADDDRWGLQHRMTAKLEALPVLSSLFTPIAWYEARIKADAAPIRLFISCSTFPSLGNKIMR